MKKTILCRFAAVLMFFIISIQGISAFADTGYTYNYDFWSEVQYSPDAYAVKETLTYVELGLDEKMNGAESLFVYNNYIYVCDTAHNRIIEIEFKDHKYTVTRIIDSFTGDCDVLTFSQPNDIYITDAGYMYISDPGNARVVMLTADLQYVMSFTQPDDVLFDSSIDFLPYRLIVDGAGRVYLVANHVNKGLVKYEADGTFSGFVGSTPVTYSWYKYIWKTYFMTKEQRAQTQNFVPTEYDNIAVDSEGFMYVCTTHFDEDDLSDDKAMPIRRLNSLGNDILIKNGDFPPIGDIQWSDDAGYVGSSKIVDVTALENDTYFALDSTRGRIFGYDSQGHLLYAFGGNGNKDGYFRRPISLEHIGNDLLVLDMADGQITVFTPTEYGSYIFDALEKYGAGDYEGSADSWRQVLVFNGNCDLAYIGIGRALLRQGEYREAMKYFKVKYDDDNYGKAFKLYRKEWVEDHIVILFFGFFVILLVPLIIGRIRKIKWEVAKYEKESSNRRR